MTGISNQNLFNGMASLVEDDTSYHSITTDNPYMAEIGLSVFTTGQLYNWMSQRNSRGEFVNLGYFDWGQSTPLTPGQTVESKILNGKLGAYLFGSSYASHCPTDPRTNPELEWMSFSRWEKKGRSGEYIKCNSNPGTPSFNWKYYNKYQFFDINFQGFYNTDIELRKSAGPYDFNYNLFAVPMITIDDIVSTIITLNDLSRFLPTLRAFYEKDGANFGSPLPKEWLATHEFIMDIKASKERCVQWANTIPFVARVGGQRCVKWECVKFKLHLYDFSNPKNSNRTVGLNSESLRIIVPRKDVFGRLSLNNGTGDFETPATDQAGIINQSVAVQPRIDQNGHGGSATIFVQLTKELPSCEQYKLLSEDGKTDYESPSILEWFNYIFGFAPGVGEAMPVQQQNNNPLQWAPQYLEPRISACGTNQNTNNTQATPQTTIPNEKLKITIYNFDKQSYAKDEIGFAVQIYGTNDWYWQPFASERVINQEPQGMSFTYLMMNYDNFFRTRPRLNNNKFFTVGFDATSYEERVRRYYYGEEEARDRLDTFPALQITSWDFMGPSVGGLREGGHALSCTVFNKDPDGKSWPDYEQGRYSTPFFGCVFPGGYNAGAKSTEYRNPVPKNFVVRQTGVSQRFIKDIPANTKIFDNSQNDARNNRNLTGEDNVLYEFAKGMFADGALENTLNHLPADIGTNSPNSPLINYYDIYRAFQTFKKDGNVVSPKDYQIALSGIIGKNYNNKHIWIHASDQENESLFGMTPNNKFTIQFRPLKHEVYDAFQRIDLDFSSLPDNSGERIEYNRTSFARRAAEYQTSRLSPLYTGAIYRDPVFDPRILWANAPVVKPPDGPAQPAGGYVNAATGMGIRQAGFNNGSGPAGPGWSLRYNYGLINLVSLYSSPSLKSRNGGAKIPQLWINPNTKGLNLDYDYRKLGPDWGSGAVGVIGVAFTIALKSAISLNTNCVFGMRSYHQGQNSFFGGLIQGRPWHSTFGGDGNNYNSMQNTQLYARIFQHWPKEYTVYDPSKFAVFHFNTDSDDLNYIDYYTTGNAPLSPGTYVWSDGIGVAGGSNVTSVILQALPNPERKEKLLPFSYKMKHTIGVDLNGTYIRDGSNSNDSKPTNYSVVIDVQGTGYTSVDKFKITGGNGISPEIKCKVSTDGKGKITGFEYINLNHKGYGYKQGDFLKSDQDFLSVTDGLQIIPVNTKGTGFSGRVVTGIATESPILQDQKPKSIGEPFIQLTPSIPTRQDPSSELYEPVDGSRITTIPIPSDLVSKDGLYDVFLHFHNDTSHTLIDADNLAAALEQYVELTTVPG